MNDPLCLEDLFRNPASCKCRVQVECNHLEFVAAGVCTRKQLKLYLSNCNKFFSI